MTEEAEAFHLYMYHQWVKNWKKDMQKHYRDKRRIIVRKYK